MVIQSHRTDLAIGLCCSTEYGKGCRSKQASGTAAQGSRVPSGTVCLTVPWQFPGALHSSSSPDLPGQAPRKKSEVSAVSWLWSLLRSPPVGHGVGFYWPWVSTCHAPEIPLQALINTKFWAPLQKCWELILRLTVLQHGKINVWRCLLFTWRALFWTRCPWDSFHIPGLPTTNVQSPDEGSAWLRDS